MGKGKDADGVGDFGCQLRGLCFSYIIILQGWIQSVLMHSGTEWLPTAKQPRRAEAVNIKI